MRRNVIVSIVLIFAIFGLSNCNLPPEFISDLTPPIVKEDTKVGTSVLTLVAKDPENTRLTYGLEGTDVLRVDSVSGVITLVKPLDREKVDTIRMVVTVEDKVEGAENNVMKVPLDLVIIDVNDNPPAFSQNIYRMDVSESAAVGTKLPLEIRATDFDQIGDTLRVECTHEQTDDSICDFFEVMTNDESARSFRGSLSVKKKLSFNKHQMHTGTLVVSDGEFITKSRVVVSVQDEQDTAPIFQGSTTAVVSEDVPIGSLVTTISAYDGDVGVPRKINYELVDDPYGIFNLDRESGELRTARPLDREARENPSAPLTLAVRAYETDRGLRARGTNTQSTLELSITIKDVNDEAPTFNHKEYRVTIPENSPPGTPVSDLDMVLSDADSGKNSVFSISLKDSSRRFIIEPSVATGSSSLSLRTMNHTFDYENPNDRNFILLAIAEESLTEPKLSSTATIYVAIKDENDNTPSFRQEAYTATILETSGEGTIVTTIDATDRDSGKFGSEGIRYSIFGNGAERFVVDARTGTISVAPCQNPGKPSCLDFETKHTYFLSLKATDNLGEGLSTTVPIRITLVDANDNPPSFSKETYRAIVLESAADFDPPLFVQAVDPDLSSRMNYSIIGGDTNNLFTINPSSGRIKIRNDPSISFSSVTNNSVILTIQATDGLLTASANVRITIRDINNNNPVFASDRYSATVLEDSEIGTTVEKVQATDSDKGINAKIKYQILKGSYGDFSIDEKTGVVSVAKNLDYNNRKNYRLNIVATDEGIPSLSSSTFMEISVMDRNDKVPFLAPKTQRVQITEDAPVGQIIYKLKAQDVDTSSSESLLFSVSGISFATKKDGSPLSPEEALSLEDWFQVNQQGEVSIRRNLNRNVTTEVSLAVGVQDSSAPSSQIGRGHLIITIMEINRHAPMFAQPWTEQKPYITVSIAEEAPINSVVTTISAFDLDSNIASYTFLEPSTNAFAIDEATGVVTVQKRLDFEKVEKIQATIQVIDTGRPQLSSTAVLLVQLENINDEQPVFEKKMYEASVNEHSEPETKVLSVKATDADKQAFGTITYYIIGSNVQYFTIDSSGNIFVARGMTITRDEIKEFNLRVIAEDSGPASTRRRTSVPVKITVVDVNDNRPVFVHKTYSAVINENLPRSSLIPVLQVSATDKDDSALTYTIIQSTTDDTSSFLLNSTTGIFYAVPPIKVSEETKFMFTIQVTDGDGIGKPDTATIEVTIIPQNENKPIFSNPPYADFVFRIQENGGAMEVTTFKASDKDEGENGVLSYHLRVGDQNLQETSDFILDPTTGKLSTKHSLDRETNSHYQLVLVARDHGTPNSYETLTIVNIQVEDIDDNQPEFTSESASQTYKFKIRENVAKDTFVGNVHATDSDVGENARIFYYLAEGNTNSKLSIDKSNGNLFTSDTIDREEIPSFNLLVLASNDPNVKASAYKEQKNQSFAYVRIDVEDENDTPPHFSQEIFYAGVPPVAEVGRLVTEVKAQDEDRGINGTVHYSIKTSTVYLPGHEKPLGSIVPSPFNITEKGYIIAASPMAPYKRHRFLLDITAREAASPFRTTTCKINVWVWEREELIKVVLEQRPEEVALEREKISKALSYALKGTTVIDEIRYFTHQNNSVDRNWSEVLIHVVNETSGVVTPEEVLFKADRAFAALRTQKESSKIRRIYPVVQDIKEVEIDARIGGLIALLVALTLGFLTFAVVYCCLKVWIMSPARSKEKLIHKSHDEDLGVNTTENPLWVDQKFKRYEEQELSMHVASEMDGNLNRQPSDALFHDDAQSNTYATIQKSLGGTVRSHHLKNLNKQDNRVLSLGNEVGESNDYATLDHLRQGQLSQMFQDQYEGSPGSLDGSSNMFNRPLPAEPANRPQRSTEEPCLVAELL